MTKENNGMPPEKLPLSCGARHAAKQALRACIPGLSEAAAEAMFDKLPQILHTLNDYHASQQDAWILTHTGRGITLYDITPDDIDIEDIAYSLSRQCRFNGHPKRFYSVAEHCCHASRLVETSASQWALLHDAAEAYVGDLSSPMKRLVPGFNIIEKRVLRAIATKFGLAWPMPDEVRRADLDMLYFERTVLMPEGDRDWEFPHIPQSGNPVSEEEVSQELAKHWFIIRFEELF